MTEHKRPKTHPEQRPRTRSRTLGEKALVARVYQVLEGKLTKADLDTVVQATFDEMAKALSQGESILYLGFGKFYPVQTKARQGRNPRTGEPITIPARQVPRFRPGRILRNMVSGR